MRVYYESIDIINEGAGSAIIKAIDAIIKKIKEFIDIILDKINPKKRRDEQIRKDAEAMERERMKDKVKMVGYEYPLSFQSMLYLNPGNMHDDKFMDRWINDRETTKHQLLGEWSSFSESGEKADNEQDLIRLVRDHLRGNSEKEERTYKIEDACRYVTKGYEIDVKALKGALERRKSLDEAFLKSIRREIEDFERNPTKNEKDVLEYKRNKARVELAAYNSKVRSTVHFHIAECMTEYLKFCENIIKKATSEGKMESKNESATMFDNIDLI